MHTMEDTMTSKTAASLARLNDTAIAFGAACVDRGSVEYAAARGAFYAAILERTEMARFEEAPARPEPLPIRDFWYTGRGILGG